MLSRHVWLSIGLFSLSVFDCFAQPVIKNLRHDLPPKDVYTIVENSPAFPDGFPALKDYLVKHLNYPAAAHQAGVAGKVFVSFIVERDGSLTDIQVLKGIGFGCDEEAVRVVREMPRWKPGTQSGVPLRVRYRIPILFGMPYPANYPRHRGY